MGPSTPTAEGRLVGCREGEKQLIIIISDINCLSFTVTETNFAGFSIFDPFFGAKPNYRPFVIAQSRRSIITFEIYDLNTQYSKRLYSPKQDLYLSFDVLFLKIIQ